MGTIASQITSLTTVYSTVYSDADQRKHQSSASLAFVRGIHRGPVNSPHKWSVMRDDVIMCNTYMYMPHSASNIARHWQMASQIDKGVSFETEHKYGAFQICASYLYFRWPVCVRSDLGLWSINSNCLECSQGSANVCLGLETEFVWDM